MSKVTSISPQRLDWLVQQPLDTKIAVLKDAQQLYEILANDILEDFARQYVGLPYSRGNDYYRHGFNPSSLSFSGERIPVRVPRIRDKHTKECFNVPQFKEMLSREDASDQFLDALLAGLSTRNYDGIVGQFIENSGLSKSSVSREFVKKSSNKLKELQERSLANEKFVALMIDGKSTLGDQVIIAMGITDTGQKKVLGLVQAATENHRPVKALLSTIVERGFSYSNGLLAVVDGSKGLTKAVKETFGNEVIIQRCQWHKRENVLSYLPKKDREYWKNALSKAYKMHNYKEAKAELKTLAKKLESSNISAARSLREGLKESLSLQKLGISFEFSRSLSTTNCIENLNGTIQRHIRNNTKWQSSNHLQRWIAASCLKAEEKMRKITGCKKLPKLEKALKRYINKQKKTT